MTAPQRKSSPSNVLSGRHVTPARATPGPAPRRCRHALPGRRRPACRTGRAGALAGRAGTL